MLTKKQHKLLNFGKGNVKSIKTLLLNNGWKKLYKLLNVSYACKKSVK